MQKNIFPRVKFGLAICAASLLFSMPCLAKGTERKDVIVGLKTLPMLGAALDLPLVVGVVYDPADSVSKADAEGIKAVLESGVKTEDKGSVAALMVPLTELDKLSQVRVAFVAQGVSNHFDAVAQMAASHNILTMSSDMACAQENKCVLGIASMPIVEIYYSSVASKNARIDFDPAFIMLVKKV